MSLSAGTATRNAEPVKVWQSVQWQTTTLPGSTSASVLHRNYGFYLARRANVLDVAERR